MFSQNKYDPEIPIYIQIIKRIRQKIVSGEFMPGQRVPAVRDLALGFGVNPNTMQRSLSELEREGLLYSERTAGRFITNNTALISAARDSMAREVAETFVNQMAQMGYSELQIRKQLDLVLTHTSDSHKKEETI